MAYKIFYDPIPAYFSNFISYHSFPHASFPLAFYRIYATFSCVAMPLAFTGEVLNLQALAKTCPQGTFPCDLPF